jgi:hypothetical protein
MGYSPQRVAAFALFAVLAAGCGGAGTSPAPSRTQTAVGDRPPMAVTEVPRRPAFIDTVPAPPPAERPQGRRATESGHASFFNGEVYLGNGVYYLQLPNTNIFGYYGYLTDTHYIYHFDLGYEYVIDAGSGGAYMYDFDSSHWWYTSQSFPFPYIYDFTLAQQTGNGMLYYYPNTQSAGHYTTNPRYFYAFGAGGIVTLPAANSPTVGYFGTGAGGGFSGTLNGTTSSPLVVAISDAHAVGGPGLNIGSGSVVVNNGVGISAVRRTPQSAQPGRLEPPPDGPLESPEQYARLRSMLRRAPAGTAASAMRHTRSLPTSLGATNSFWVNAFAIGTNGSSYQQEAATLQAITTHGYIWVANSLGLSTSIANTIGQDFENAWTSDTLHFGTPLYTITAPGASGLYSTCDANGNPLVGTVPTIVTPLDSKIVVLVVDPAALGNGVGGYFESTNYIPQLALNCLIGQTYGYTAATVPRSNEAPMFFDGYFASHGTTYETGEDLVRGTAHEFQHLINFVNHNVLQGGTNYEDRWINEGMSMLAQDLAVRQLYPGTSNDVDDALYHAQLYLSAPEYVSLTAFTAVNPSTSVQTYNCSSCYGAEFLFQRYLYDRFGGDTYLKKMLGGTAVSYANLQQATGIDPTQAISDFAVALAASNTGTTTDPRFVFTGLNLHATYNDPLGLYVSTTLSGPSPVTFAPGTYNDLLGTFLYLQGTSGLRGQTVTVKSPNANFVLNAGIVQK